MHDRAGFLQFSRIQHRRLDRRRLNAQSVKPPPGCDRTQYRVAIGVLFGLTIVAALEECAIAIIALRGDSLSPEHTASPTNALSILRRVRKPIEHVKINLCDHELC